MNIRGFIFDFDGTLATLKVDFAEMKREVKNCIKTYGVPIEHVQDLYILEMVEAGVEFLSRRNGQAAENFKTEALNIIERLEVSAARAAEPIFGVPEMLIKLRERGMKTAVITRNCLRAVLTSFPSINLLVDVILTRENVRAVKPNLKHLTLALDAMGLDPGRTAMVGDHPMDIEMGKRGGLMAIGVLSGSGRREDFLLAGADYILETASDITNLLDRVKDITELN